MLLQRNLGLSVDAVKAALGEMGHHRVAELTPAQLEELKDRLLSLADNAIPV